MVSAVLAVTVVFRGYNVDILVFLCALFLSFVGIVAPLLFRSVYFNRRRLKKSTISAEYMPPLGLSPAEVSLLFNHKLGKRDIAATLVHLIQRGLLHVRNQNGEKILYVGPKVESNLKPHEKMLIDEVDTADGVSTEDMLNSLSNRTLNAGSNSGVAKEVIMQKIILDTFKKSNFIKRNKFTSYAIYILRLLILLVVTLVWLPLTISIIATTIEMKFADFGTIWEFVELVTVATLGLLIPLVLVAIVLSYIRARKYGRAWAVTPKIGRYWTQIVGFRQFVQLAEKKSLNYRSSELEKQSTLDVLPYSIALGFVDNWKDIIL